MLPIRYRAPADANFWLTALRSVRALPAVESAALVVNDSGPLHGGDLLRGGIVPDGQMAPIGGFSLSYRSVGGDYFRTLGIPLVAGRPILDSDTGSSEGVVVLNRAAAAALWPGQSPLGKRLRGGGRPLRVVGIVPDFKLTQLDGEVSLQMYTSMQQDEGGFAGSSAILLRTKPGARAIADQTKAILLNLEKRMEGVEVQTMAQVRWKLLTAERFRAAVLLVFAGTATFLALIGIFGLVSYSVAQRHREIGVRVALGATYSRIVSGVLREALVPTLLGIAAGTAGALAASRLLAAFLFGVPPRDPLTFLAAIGLFFGAAFVAALIPALRSVRVDPAVALHHD
jgi:ABC-type antimicrobial peptide transport system permease subunit